MLTSTERSRKYRERLKNDEKKLAQYREKDGKRKAREYKRQKESLSDAKKARQRAKQRNWKRSNMARQKEQKAQMSEERQRNRHREKSVPDIPKPRKGSQKGA